MRRMLPTSNDGFIYNHERVKWAQAWRYNSERGTEERTMSDEIRPFKIQVSDADLEDLKKRLRSTRWPHPRTVPDSPQGNPLEYVQNIGAYRAPAYDCRRSEHRRHALRLFHTA